MTWEDLPVWIVHALLQLESWTMIRAKNNHHLHPPVPSEVGDEEGETFEQRNIPHNCHDPLISTYRFPAIRSYDQVQAPTICNDILQDTATATTAGGRRERRGGLVGRERKRDSIGPTFQLRDDSFSTPHLNNFHTNGYHDESSDDSCYSPLQILKIIVALLLYMAIQAPYYYIHLKCHNENDLPTYVLQIMMSLVIFSFPFHLPLHRALGFASPQTPALTLVARRYDFESDSATRKYIYMYLLLSVLFTIGDTGYYWMSTVAIQNHNIHLTVWWTLLYILACWVTIVCRYTAFLWALLVARVVLCRLRSIENEVEEAVNHFVTSTYNSLRNLPDDDAERSEALAQTERWLQGYRSTRYDFHQVGQTFGWQFLLAMFLFIVNLTSMVLVCFETLKSSLSMIDLGFFLLSYSSSAIVMVSLLFNMAYIQTACACHIGPKLSMLAMRHAEFPEYSALASTFLLAPIRFHVGNFHMSSEYANAITLWFFSLFLLVFGLRAPGLE